MLKLEEKRIHENNGNRILEETKLIWGSLGKIAFRAHQKKKVAQSKQFFKVKFDVAIDIQILQ